MAQDLRDQLESAPEVEVFILGSGDRNFIAVANALKRHGKKVVVAADQESINRELRQCADEYLALPRNRGSRPLPQPEPEVEFHAPGGEELLDQVRLLTNSTDYLTIRRIVRALLPDDVSGTGRVRSALANNVQELIDGGYLRTERRVIRGRTVITLEVVDGDAGSTDKSAVVAPAATEVVEPTPVVRRRTRRNPAVSAVS